MCSPQHVCLKSTDKLQRRHDSQPPVAPAANGQARLGILGGGVQAHFGEKATSDPIEAVSRPQAAPLLSTRVTFCPQHEQDPGPGGSEGMTGAGGGGLGLSPGGPILQRWVMGLPLSLQLKDTWTRASAGLGSSRWVQKLQWPSCPRSALILSPCVLSDTGAGVTLESELTCCGHLLFPSATAPRKPEMPT